MSAEVAAAFEREMGCTEGEWLSWLPGAVREHELTLGAGSARVAMVDGALELRWQALAPRQIALVRFPRLAVSFRFEGVDAPARQRFMRYFDLYLQRGGG